MLNSMFSLPLAMKFHAVAFLSVALLFQPGHADKNQKKFESLDRSSKMEMIRKWDRFKALSPDQQETLRSFHNKLTAHSDRDSLIELMELYHNWLQELSPQQRATLRSLDPKERLAKVKSIWRSQNHFRPVLGDLQSVDLDEEDEKAFASWFLPQISEHWRRGRWGRRKSERFRNLPKISEKKFSELRSILSDRGKKIMDLNKKQLTKLVEHWRSSIFRSAPTHKELADTYESLSQASKDKLSQMNVEDIQNELRRAFFLNKFKKFSGKSPFGSRDSKRRNTKDRSRKDGAKRNGEKLSPNQPSSRSQNSRSPKRPILN